jgi:RNA polymerase sigma-70 factor (family 1)
MNDRDLITQLQAGDKASFEFLYHRYKSKVYNTSISFVQNVEEAEEVTQDVFVELFRSANSYRADSSLSTWIYRITVNKSLDTLRQKKRKKRKGFLISLFRKDEREPQIDVAHFDHPGVALENKELAQVLFRAIETLPNQQKSAFILSQVEGLPQQEIATILKISEKAVESLVQRAKANLKKKLQIFYPDRRK